MGRLTHTRTYCVTRIVVVHLKETPTSSVRIYLADYMAESRDDLDPAVSEFLRTRCARVFNNFKDMTEFLIEYPAIVEDCLIMSASAT